MSGLTERNSADAGGSGATLLRMKGIGKSFSGVDVLDGIGFKVKAGEVHVLAGENGAGKTTLIKILAGAYTEFRGSMELFGKRYRPHSPLDARRRGVAVIHQELSLVPFMSVADNIFLGRSPAACGFVRRRRQRQSSAAALKRLGLRLNVDRPVADYPIAARQMIEIVKALSQKARVIVMDEPTSALNAPEVERLFNLVGQLKEQGCGIVYITHKMEEIERVADHITVLRDGRRVVSAPASEMPPSRLIEHMVGRKVDQQFPRHTPELGEEILKLESFSVCPEGLGAGPAAKDISLELRAGEIMGIGGLRGSGASELLLGVFGAYGKRTRGKMILDGRPVNVGSPRQGIREGIAMLTNDRKATGLVLGASVISNTVLADLDNLSRAGWCRVAREREATRATTDPLHLRATSLAVPVSLLSGGNQQKVAFAKWMQTRPKLLLLDEPTRGIDVGAKREIYDLMNEWTASGIAILLITSEMPELLAMSDRIMVMHRGRCTAELPARQASPAEVLEAAMGHVREGTAA